MSTLFIKHCVATASNPVYAVAEFYDPLNGTASCSQAAYAVNSIPVAGTPFNALQFRSIVSTCIVQYILFVKILTYSTRKLIVSCVSQ